MSSPQEESRPLNRKKAAEFVGVSERTLARWRINRRKDLPGPRGPRFILVGKVPHYLREELLRYLKEGEEGEETARAGAGVDAPKPRKRPDVALPRLAPPR